MQDVCSGTTNGKKWLVGNIPMKQNISLYLDTRSGTGVTQVLDYLHDFITYQASHIKLPSFSKEDVIQELIIIALVAMPDYDVSKNANMLTFLQNHIKNRIVNIYKHSTEQCRTATHENFRFCKIKCPKCKQYIVVDQLQANISFCYHCGRVKKTEEVWRSYPIQIPFLSTSEEFSLSDDDGSKTTIQEYYSYDDISILGGNRGFDSESKKVERLSIYSIVSTLDEVTRNIVILFLAGHSITEISKKIKLSSNDIRLKISALSDNKDFIEMNK